MSIFLNDSSSATRSLINTTFRVITKRIPYYVGLEKKENKMVFTDNGWYSALFLMVQQNLGFKYDLVVEDNSGFRLKNGTWTGHTGSLISEKSDLAFPLVLTWERFPAVDFCFPVMNERIVFFVRAPREVSKALAMIRPFSLQLWIAVGISLIFGMAVLHIMFRFGTRIDYPKSPSAANIFWALFSTLVAQGNRIFFLRVNAITVFMACWLFCISTLVYGYAGSLMSFITLPGTESTVTTFEKLSQVIRDGSFTGSTIKHTTIESFIRRLEKGKSASLKQSFEKKRIVALNVSIDPLVRVLEGNHAYITYDIYGIILATKIGEEKLRMSDDALYSTFSSFAIRKSFLHTKQFCKLMNRCVETGLVMKVIRNEIDKSRKERLRSEDDGNFAGSYSLRIEDLQGVFLILIIGYALAVLSLIGELLIQQVVRSSA